MKKTLTLITLIFCALTTNAQEVLTLDQCRQLALDHNKQMAAATKQTQAASYLQKSYKGNFFPNFMASGTGLYSSANGTFGIPGGNLPTFVVDANGQPAPNGGFAFFPGIDLNYKVRTVWMGGIAVEQPIYMGGKIVAAYRMATLGKQMAQLNETLTASEVILETDQAYALMVKAQEMNKVATSYQAVLVELMKNVESAYKHGLKSKNDVLKVQVKLNESELAIRKAENALRLAGMNLCHLIGKPLTETLHIADDFPAMLELAERYGVSELVVLVFKPNADHELPSLPTGEQVREIAKTIRAYQGPVKVTVEGCFSQLRAVLNQRFFTNLNRGVSRGCGAGRDGISVSADGKLTPCRHLEIEEDWDDILAYWQGSETLKKLRAMEDEPQSPCNSCKYQRYCLPCAAVNYKQKGSIFMGCSCCPICPEPKEGA